MFIYSLLCSMYIYIFADYSLKQNAMTSQMSWNHSFCLWEVSWREVWWPLLPEATRRWNILSLKLRIHLQWRRYLPPDVHGLGKTSWFHWSFFEREWKRSENVDWYGWFGWFSYTEVDEILELKSLIFPTELRSKSLSTGEGSSFYPKPWDKRFGPHATGIHMFLVTRHWLQDVFLGVRPKSMKNLGPMACNYNSGNS